MHFLFFLFAIFVLLPLAYAGFSFAPYHGCRKRDLERILRLAELKEGSMFYDLGCGDGRVALYAAQHSSATVQGIELVFPLYLLCRLKAWIGGRPQNLTFSCRNFFHMDLSQADVVYVYGMSRTLEHKVKAKLERELRPGARVISYVFWIRGWEPVLMDQPTKKDLPIYLYRR